MTTIDPVLVFIENEIAKIETWLEEGDIIWTSQERIDEANASVRPWLALKSAAEKHIPYEDSDNCPSCLEGRDSDPVTFPCPEYTDIAEKLGVVL